MFLSLKADSTRRAIRTALDTALAFLIALGAGAAILATQVDDFAIFGATPGQFAAIGAVIVALTAAVNKVKNSLEEAGVIPAVLKGPAPAAGDLSDTGDVQEFLAPQRGGDGQSGGGAFGGAGGRRGGQEQPGRPAEPELPAVSPVPLKPAPRKRAVKKTPPKAGR